MASTRFRFVAEITVRVDAAGTQQTFLFATSGFTTRPTDTPANTLAAARLADPGTLQRDLFSGARVSGGVRSGFGQLLLSNADGALDAWVGYGTGGGKVVLRWGPEQVPEAAYPAAYTTVYVAYIAGTPHADFRTLRFTLRDRSYLLDRPVVTQTFAGTGGQEGDNPSQRKRLVIGDPGLIPLVQVDADQNLYYVQANGAAAAWCNDLASAVTALYDAGVEVPFTRRFSSYENLRDHSGGTPDRWAMWAADGITYTDPDGATNPRTDAVGPVYIKHTPPAEGRRGELRIRCDGRLKNYAADSVRAWRFTDMCQRAGLADVTPAALASGSVDFGIGHRLLDGEQTFAAVFNDCARAEILAWGMNRLDQAFAFRLRDPSESASAGDTVKFRFTKHNCGGIKRIPVPGMENPVHQLFVSAGRTWPSMATGSDADIRRELERQTPYIAFSATAQSVLTAHPSAEVVKVDLDGRYFTTRLEQQAYANRFMQLYGGLRDCFLLEVRESAVRGDFATLLSLELHDKVELELSRFGCTPARTFRIVTIQTNLKERTITFGLWGGAQGPAADGDVVIADVPRAPGGSGGGGSVPGGSPTVPTGAAVKVLGKLPLGAFRLRGRASFAAEPARMKQSLGPFVLRGRASIARADPHFDKVVLLLHGNGANGSTTIVDSSSYARTVTAVGNAQVSTDIASMFAGASIKVDGTGDYLTMPDAAEFNFGAGAVAWEAFIYLTSASSAQCLMAKMSATTGLQYEWGVFVGQDYATFYYGIRGTNNAQIRLYWPNQLPLNTRVRIGVERSVYGQWGCFLEGVKGTQYQVSPLNNVENFGSITSGVHTDAVNVGDTSNPVWVGNNHVGQSLSAYFEELRMTVGASRGDSGYSVELEPFPDI